MQKLKKILIYTGGGIGGLFALLIVASMFMGTSSLPDMEEDARVSDQKLDALREREAELQDVYEGEGNAFFTPESDEELYANVGELSDFDAPPVAPAPPSSDPEDSPFHNDNALSNTSLVAEPNNGAPFENDPLLEAAPEDVEMPQSEEHQVEHPSDVASVNTNPDPTPLLLEEIAALETRVGRELEQFERVLTRIEAQLNDAPRQENIASAVRDDLQLIRQSQSEIANQASDARSEVIALATRIESLESARTRAATQRLQPSSTELRNLYELDRIEGGTAILIGQNTGRRFIMSEGDSLAYGGHISAIRGDRVTLRWPNMTTTLSIY
jgi:hypothetical protein